MKVLSPCANKSFDFGKHVKRGKYHQNQILTVHKVEVWECTFDGHWPWRRFELCSGADSKLDYLHFYLLNYRSRAMKFPRHWSIVTGLFDTLSVNKTEYQSPAVSLDNMSLQIHIDQLL